MFAAMLLCECNPRAAMHMEARKHRRCRLAAEAACCWGVELRQMRLSADAEKKEAHLAKSTMGSIEKAAAAQYAKDQAEAERHQKETLGRWDCQAVAQLGLHVVWSYSHLADGSQGQSP